MLLLCWMVLGGFRSFVFELRDQNLQKMFALESGSVKIVAMPGEWLKVEGIEPS